MRYRAAAAQPLALRQVRGQAPPEAEVSIPVISHNPVAAAQQHIDLRTRDSAQNRFREHRMIGTDLAFLRLGRHAESMPEGSELSAM